MAVPNERIQQFLNRNAYVDPSPATYYLQDSFSSYECCCHKGLSYNDLTATMFQGLYKDVHSIDWSLTHDVAFIKKKAGPYLSLGLKVYRYRYDIMTGKLHAVA